jgi:LPS O-antigen subunit length determinant protein (WzzB/FepE family)
MVYPNNCDIIEEFDDNPLSQNSARDFVQCVMAAPNFTPSLMELSSQCDKAVNNKIVSTVAIVHRPATPRKRQLSNESSIFTDMSGSKKINSNDNDQTMLSSSDMPASLLVEMFASLSSDFKSAVSKIEIRIDHLESNIKKMLIEKVSDNVLKKVKGEIDSVKSDFGKLKLMVFLNRIQKLRQPTIRKRKIAMLSSGI